MFQSFVLLISFNSFLIVVAKPYYPYNLFKISLLWIESMLTLFVCNKKLSDLTPSVLKYFKKYPDISLKNIFEMTQIGQLFIKLADMRASRAVLSLSVWEIHRSVWEIFPKFICIVLTLTHSW